jgi:hypothetical protein
MEWGMVIMGYVQVRLKYPDVFQPAHKTDSSDESVKNRSDPGSGIKHPGSATLSVGTIKIFKNPHVNCA